MMVAQRVKPLPFLTTHVANIALNKKIGLIFLQSHPQETHGLTVVSEESFDNDQLQVAGWMLAYFAGSVDGDDVIKNQAEPWVEMPDYDPRTAFSEERFLGFSSPAEIEQVINRVEAIAQEISGSEVDPWDQASPKARKTIFKLLRQIEECVRYTNGRVAAVQLAANLFDVAEKQKDLGAIMDILISRGTQIGEAMLEIIQRDGMLAIMTAYLRIKNQVTAEMAFSSRFRKIAVDIVTPRAIQEGYSTVETVS